VHLSAVTVLLTGVALSIASMVTFLVSSAHNRDATCDHWPLLAADLLMYLALSHTVTGFFSPYLYMLNIMPTPVEQAEMSMILIGITIAGTTAWILAAYVESKGHTLSNSHGSAERHHLRPDLANFMI
jgi:hypothetical protein